MPAASNPAAKTSGRPALEICLDMNGKLRPDHFGTSPGSGRAYETLRRTSTSRPDSVTGGTAPNAPSTAATQDSAGFEFVESATLTKLQGEWTAVKIVRDDEELPSMMLRSGIRIATKNEVKISMGGRTMIHAIVRIDEHTDPMHVDYSNLEGMFKGAIQHGLLKWSGNEACFCMAAPGSPRPDDFTTPSGSGRTFSQWRPKK